MTAQRQSDGIELFTQSHCGSCREVERFLRSRGIDFTVRSVDTDAAALEEISARGYMTTPVTRIGDRWIAGFKRGALERALEAIGHR